MIEHRTRIIIAATSLAVFLILWACGILLPLFRFFLVATAILATGALCVTVVQIVLAAYQKHNTEESRSFHRFQDFLAPKHAVAASAFAATALIAMLLHWFASPAVQHSPQIATNPHSPIPANTNTSAINLIPKKEELAKNNGATQHPSNRKYTQSQLRMMISGTYETLDGNPLSITFTYPAYRLNPMGGKVWAKGNTGTWDIYTDHNTLSATDQSLGKHVLGMTAPDDPNFEIPSNVKLEYDDNGVSQITFSSFFGIPLAEKNHSVMVRKE